MSGTLLPPGLAEAIAAEPAPMHAVIGGVKIVTSALLTERVPCPRSPARARRRLRQRGIPPHHAERPAQAVYTLPDGTMVMHPARLEWLRAALRLREAARTLRETLAEIRPPPVVERPLFLPRPGSGE